MRTASLKLYEDVCRLLFVLRLLSVELPQFMTGQHLVESRRKVGHKAGEFIITIIQRKPGYFNLSLPSPLAHQCGLSEASESVDENQSLTSAKPICDDLDQSWPLTNAAWSKGCEQLGLEKLVLMQSTPPSIFYLGSRFLLRRGSPPCFELTRIDLLNRTQDSLHSEPG